MLLLLICLSIFATSGVFGQDIDNVVTPNGRKSFTILDEIEDHGERTDSPSPLSRARPCPPAEHGGGFSQ